MSRVYLPKKILKNYKRLLCLGLTVIFIITAIWTPVLGETKGNDKGSWTNPEIKISYNEQNRRTKDDTNGNHEDENEKEVEKPENRRTGRG